MDQKCFLLYTGKDGRVASTSRGNGWTEEGMEAFNENLKNVCNDRDEREDMFDKFFIDFCREKHKEELKNSGFLQVSRSKQRSDSNISKKNSPKRAKTKSLKISELRNNQLTMKHGDEPWQQTTTMNNADEEQW